MERMHRPRYYSSRKETRKPRTKLIIGSIFASLFLLPVLKSLLFPTPTVNLHVPKKAHVQKLMAETESSPPKPVEESKEEEEPAAKPKAQMEKEEESSTAKPQANMEEEEEPSTEKPKAKMEEEEEPSTAKPKAMCEESEKRSLTCEVVGDVVIQGNSTTIFIPSHYSSPQHKEWKIKPYNRQSDSNAMEQVTELSLKSSISPEKTPQCTKNYSVPAVIFSIAGYAGNLFHDFTDVLVPLFITSHQFHGDVQFIVANSKPWWITKFSNILKQLSKYELIDLSLSKDVHCFQSKVIVGTTFHKELGVDPSKTPNGYSMAEFKGVLRKAFSLERETAIQIGHRIKQKPRMLIISRTQSRKFVNEWRIVEMAKSLRYDVVVSEPTSGTDVAKFARLVNSCDVFMGVHGAGLTNMVFLPDGAVVIQIIPLGGLEWLAKENFKQPALSMKLKYLEYRIQEEESTLIEQYPRNDPVIKDPFSIQEKGWAAVKSIYLDKQNVRVHLGRLKNTLSEALKLLQQNN